jgi:hypothetical protein
MNAYSRKNEHRAITLALSTISGIIVTVVAAESVLTSGIFERQMRMLVPMRPFESFEANINNEVRSLKDAVQKIERRIELLSNPPEAAAGVEIGKTKDLVMELSTKENKIEEIIPQNLSKGSGASKVSRTRSSRPLHRKRWH